MVYRPPVIEIADPVFEVAEGTQHPEFAIPTQVRQFIVNHDGLDSTERRIIDPMMGNADFLNDVMKGGGLADGIELAPDQFRLAEKRLAPFGSAFELILGDCTQAVPQHINEGYDEVWTSWPFVLADHLANNVPRSYEEALHWDDFAIAFHRMLRWDGRLFMDSADKAMRNGRHIYPATDTARYLGRFYFELVAEHRFIVPKPPSGFDDSFTEQVYRPLWKFRPGMAQAWLRRDMVRRFGSLAGVDYTGAQPGICR